MSEMQAQPATQSAEPATEWHYSHWPKTGVRIAFGTVWLVDAALKWTGHFRNGYIDHLEEGSEGRPGWLDPWFRFCRLAGSGAALLGLSGRDH